MAQKNTTQTRMNNETMKILRKLSAERFSSGLDKIQLPPYKLIDATLRIPNVLNILKTSRIKNDK